LAITSRTSGGRSVGIVRSRTQTMEFLFFNDEGKTKDQRRKEGKIQEAVGLYISLHFNAQHLILHKQGSKMKNN
jgi:hypothetical protein